MTGTGATLIKNVTLYDGSGSPPVVADVAFARDCILNVGTNLGAGSARSIDGQGLALAPGFIDTHTHDDCALLTTDMSAKLSQGVTTVVTGNCGISPA
jgi:N-acyl-D-amino-acid deacylase